jgi:hypothetical protein
MIEHADAVRQSPLPAPVNPLKGVVEAPRPAPGSSRELITAARQLVAHILSRVNERGAEMIRDRVCCGARVEVICELGPEESVAAFLVDARGSTKLFEARPRR